MMGHIQRRIVALQQPNAEAVGLEEFIESLYAAGWKSSGDAQWTQITALHAKLFTHPSQVITRDRLIEILDGHSSDFGHDSCVFAVREEDYANAVDAILAEINRSQETKL